MLPKLEEISKRRRVLGLSQKHLARLAGVSQSMIAKIEADDFESLGDIVVNKIRTIEGVIDTKTLTGTKF